MVDRLARKRELDALAKRVDALSKKVDALNKQANVSTHDLERQESRVEVLENKLTRELPGMGVKILTCHKCGRQIPSRDYTFCPFCGVVVEKQI